MFRIAELRGKKAMPTTQVLETPGTLPGFTGRKTVARKGAQVVERVFNILEAFSVDEPELTATQLSLRLGLHKATVHRLVSVLEARGFLERDPRSRAYMLGHGLLRFVELVRKRNDLVSIVMPYMTRLRAATDETVGVHVRSGSERICIGQLESSHELRMRLEIGKPLPIYCGAASKVLLAAMEPDEIDAVIRKTKLRPLGPGSIRSKFALAADLKAILENGYAISREERVAGGITVAAPIRDSSGVVLASLSIYAPLLRADRQRLASWISLIQESARLVSAELGFRETLPIIPKEKKKGVGMTGRKANESRRKNGATKGRRRMY
jgi:IclR family transcriptional regulator, KDG regulon repressor